MRLFLRSRWFKIMLAVIAALLAVMIVVLLVGKYASPQTSFISVITSPIEKASAFVTEKARGIAENFASNDALRDENAELRQKISEYENDLQDYEKTKQDNEYYKQFLGLKQEHEDFELKDARVIARDANDALFKTFTIDTGSLDGVSKYDPVVAQGNYLVGYVYDVSPSQSTVMTVLDPSINISAAVNRTSDTGNVTGEVTLAEQNCCKMTGLDRSSAVTAGDRIVTTALGGYFPDGLIIGTVREIKPSGSDISNYAVIEPAADFDNIAFVMVITDFDGRTPIDG